jgi:hypothetical protein
VDVFLIRGPEPEVADGAGRELVRDGVVGEALDCIVVPAWSQNEFINEMKKRKHAFMYCVMRWPTAFTSNTQEKKSLSTHAQP